MTRRVWKGARPFFEATSNGVGNMNIVVLFCEENKKKKVGGSRKGRLGIMLQGEGERGRRGSPLREELVDSE